MTKEWKADHADLHQTGRGEQLAIVVDDAEMDRVAIEFVQLRLIGIVPGLRKLRSTQYT